MIEDIHIAYKINKNGFRVKVNKEFFNITYPQEVWDRFPSPIKKETIENFIFLATQTLPLLMDKENIRYEMNSPVLKSLLLNPVLNYIPFSNDSAGNPNLPSLRSFINMNYKFDSHRVKLPNYNPRNKDRSVILFTFGKESLLNFAVSEEIGLDPVLVYVQEPDIKYMDETKQEIQNMYEIKHKNDLVDELSKEFGKEVYRIENMLGVTRYPEYFNLCKPDIGWATQLTEYALLMLPFTHYFHAKHIVFGNEASCSEHYLTEEGFRMNPVYDQSKPWTFELSKMLHILTKQVSAMSLVEPLHELAIIKILHQRYPAYAKYQMSCFADSNTAKNSRWCHSCSKCARIYVMIRALGIDPKSINIRKDMFTKENKSYFSIFNEDNNNMKPYDYSGLGRDEMLYAFYLAYKRGAKGYLISQFKRKFLKEAMEREDELHNEFMTLHTSDTIPKKIAAKVCSIYQEELDR
ncbi:hypothetical protein COV93_02665 [Candidatus Woesearchaeota archaeon CG11_big_fil_rev_8_21_14_0_20_43_8]|nr:MAG: hypothetical protein COV93_02665 [Candidatus Woesearchaeota archaeon CG11_big_fil_rev_8_21_14_0_20_43_8]